MSSSTNSVERVRTLLKTSTTKKSELIHFYNSLLAELHLQNLVSEDDLLGLFRRGKLSRCFEIGWCFPQEYHDFQAIRLVNYQVLIKMCCNYKTVNLIH